MLAATFCCFNGVSTNSERRLWSEGFLSWNDLLRSKPLALSEAKWENIKSQVPEAMRALESGMAEYFLARLSVENRIRLWPDFQDKLVGLDIETSGLDFDAEIITIAMHTIYGSRVYVKNADLAQWDGILENNSVLVTYNGTRFDLPILRQCFGVSLEFSHIDMMYILRSHGYRGGQKACEQNLRIKRKHSAGMRGMDVCDLWKIWIATKNINVLKQIVLYNAEDASSLFALGWKAYKMSMVGYPLRLPASPVTSKAKIEWFDI